VRSFAILVVLGGTMRHEFDRFIEKVTIPENKDADCWEWTGAKYRGGYGHFGRRKNNKWVMEKAHRYSMEYYNGAFDPSLVVCHKCDNPGCVNPKHLFTGTQKDNIRDKIQKGKQHIIRNPLFNNLELETVRKIREDYKNGLSQTALMSKYKQSRPQISRVVNHKIWKE
jgi:hypothetical protein